MSNNLQKLVEYFSSIIRKYGNTNGTNDKLYLAALEFYKNGLSDWHNSESFSDVEPINNKRKIEITNTILDFINLMRNSSIKENHMKKSELRALINEVVKEVSDDWLTNDQDPAQIKKFRDAGGLDNPAYKGIGKYTGSAAPHSDLDEQDDKNNPLYVEYVSDRQGEEPFMMGGQKFQFVNAKYPTGKKDIGVYAFSGDVVYGYQAFRQMHNLKEGSDQVQEIGSAPSIDSDMIDWQKHVANIAKGFLGKNNAKKDQSFNPVKVSYGKSQFSKKPKIAEDGVGNGWKKADIRNSMSDEGQAWRTFIAKNFRQDRELAKVFMMAVSDGEDPAKPMEQIGNGVYTSENHKVEVDLHKGTYRITKLQ